MKKDIKLSNQDLESINGGVENDKAFYRYVMGCKYKCNACGHTWEVTSKPTECEKCHSEDIEKN